MSHKINPLIYEYIIKMINPTINMFGVLPSLHNMLMLDGDFYHNIYKYYNKYFPTMCHNITGEQKYIPFDFKQINSSKYDIILSVGSNDIFKKYCKHDINKDFIFIKNCMKTLNNNGMVGIIINNKLLFSNKKIAIKYRKMLIEKYNMYRIIIINNNMDGYSIIFLNNIGTTITIDIKCIDIVDGINIIETNNYIADYNYLKNNDFNINYLINPIKYIDTLLNNFNINDSTEKIPTRKRSCDENDIDTLFKKLKLKKDYN